MPNQSRTPRNAVRPTTEIEEAIAQLTDHRMSANPIAEIRMPQQGHITHQVRSTGDRFGFPVEFGS